MALITISGYPCSGKTRRAGQIRESLERYLRDGSYQGPLTKAIVLSDEDLDLDRAVYDGPSSIIAVKILTSPTPSLDSRSEKSARGVLFTALQRHMASDAVLIVDALNYIKGFRYQMYCAAREMKLRVCTVR